MFVGNGWDALWNHGLVGKLIAPYAQKSIKNIVLNANFATYVTQKYLQKIYPTKCKSIGVSDVRIEDVSERHDYSNINKDKNITLLTAAGLDVKYKGQQYVIKAMKILKENNINVTYYLAGVGAGTYLLEEAEKYGLKNNIKKLGLLSQDELKKYMNQTDFYIQPSLQEGLPRAVVEAMSQGCICLGTNLPGIAELLDNNKLFNKKDYVGIAKLIKSEIIKSEEELDSESSRNIKVAKEYLSYNLSKKRNEYYDYVKKCVEKN